MKSTSQKSAFTLIELLVVISIILIASSIIFIGGTGGDGAALSSSQRILSGLAQGARGQAILKNAETRLIINNDPDELDKYRRFFGIVYQGTDSNGNVGWIAATQGTYLPEGIYFDAATSEGESSGNWSSSANTMNIDFPRLTAQAGAGGSHEYLYYEFNSNGTSANSNAYLVLRAGTMIPSGSGAAQTANLTATTDQEFLRTALIFRRAGTTTPVTDPDAITLSSVTEIN